VAGAGAGQSVKSAVTWQFMRTDHDDVTTKDVSRRRQQARRMTRSTPQMTVAFFIARHQRIMQSMIRTLSYAVIHCIDTAERIGLVFVQRLPLVTVCPGPIHGATYGNSGIS